MKKLKDSKKPVEHFLSHARILKSHLGPILFQLPPHWKVNEERLKRFTDILPKGLKYVFEFRDKSWYKEEVYEILSKRKMSLCLHDMPEAPSPMIPVGPIIYLRFHGTGGLYGGKYTLSSLRGWASFMKKMLSKGKDVYAYFNNDAEANAPKDALRLIKEISRK